MNYKFKIVTEEEKLTIENFKGLEKTFKNLKKFALYKDNYKYIDILHGGRTIKFKNFVGTITTSDGTTIEILPKIYGLSNKIDEQRKILIKMLTTIKKFPFKKLDKKTTLSYCNLPILEIFISIFLNELSSMVKKGIKKSYIEMEENSTYIKGKINVSKNIQKNFLNQTKHYSKYDEYSDNITENKIIKFTLVLLLKISHSSKNKKVIKQILSIFHEIDLPHNINSELKKIKDHNAYLYYKEIFNWCFMFIKNYSFSPYTGQGISYSLLFNMGRLFESYVTNFFETKYSMHNIKKQHQQFALLESHFLVKIKPDIVLNNKFVFDAKWKIVNSAKKKYDIDDSDLYQLFCYGKKYKAKEVSLIYPKSENFKKSSIKELYYDKNLYLNILCFDCLNFTLDF